MDSNSAGQEKLIKHLLKKDPSLSQQDLDKLLVNIKRFVTVTRKIYTEPQAKVSYTENREKILTTTIQELRKVMTKPSEPIEEVFRKFNKEVTKNEEK